jgi:hypothetical protein
VNTEFERIWKEAVVTYFVVLSRHLSGGVEENHEEPWSGWPVFVPRYQNPDLVNTKQEPFSLDRDVPSYN